MKKIVFLLLLFTVFILPQKTLAYQQTEAVCYSQCAAYKFYWKGDFCWDLFTNQCSVSSGDMIKNAISLVKKTAQAMATGKLMTIIDVSEVFKAMAICKPLIEDCIVPQLQACENTCKNISQTYYSPELSVGNPFGSVYYHNVYYDESKHELVFKVVNYGGYAWDIGVTASWGHTRNRDKMVSGGGTFFTEKIPEMLFFGARIGSPKTPGDYVGDFLIDQSNFAKYLQKYKSDADNHYIPPVWYKTVPFTAPEGEYTKVILNVDQDKLIPEGNEGDNTYILEIDKLPTPASFYVENLTYRRTDPNNLERHLVDFELKNKGEESGNAHVKWYLGKYEAGKTPFHEQEMVILAKDKVNFSHIFDVDVSSGSDSCNHSQKYTLVVFDDDGLIKTTQEFYIPQYAGSISGRVEDLFGKKIVGATITTSTGQSSTVNEYGYYHIKGIAILGKVTVTATHPEFSQPATKEVEIKFIPDQNKCDVEGLTQNGVNFVLKDQDVFFNVLVKDTNGNPITAHVLASNQDWRFEQDVEGQAPLPGMQPGKYNFILSAAGYKTISQTVNAVPNQQNLEFKMEKLNGRQTDGGLTIFEPRLLWQMNRGEEILAQTTATKDGKELILYTTRNKLNSGKLYFLDLTTGRQIKVVNSTISTRGQSQSCLDTSYDGNTTALYVHTGTFGIAGDTRNTVKLFNNQGNEFGMTDFQSGGGVSVCDVSPDGFYVYPERLMNKGLYVYTRHDIFGIEKSEEDVGYTPHEAIHFTTQNNIIAGCPEGDGDQCVQTVNQNVVSNLGNFDYGARSIDSSQDGTKIGFTTIKKVYFYTNASKLWEKDIRIFNDWGSISVSPGGKYVIYSTVTDAGAYRTVKVFTDNNIEKTPGSLPHPGREDVLFVHANDKGIYFLTAQQKNLKFYQVGEYSTDYNPTSVPSVTPQVSTGSLSYYSDGNFYQAGNKTFAQLEDGVIYLANQSMVLDMGSPNGSLNILGGTIFSVDINHRPILLKGQMTADFSSPAIIYAIKFDRYDLSLFRAKLNQFRSGTLADDEYFVVRNIHTRFTVRNYANHFNVAVDSGQINVLSDKKEKIIGTNSQVTIDAKNNMRESFYFGRLARIITVILLLISFAILFIYRKTKTGKMIINILKKIAILIWKYVLISIKWLWEMIKKLIKRSKKD